MSTRPRSRRKPASSWQNIGQVILASYLICVVVIAILQHLTGHPTVQELASSPTLLAEGQWWRLITSGLIVQGPAVPQVLAIAVLGGAGIYFGGSWLFWRTALLGHVVGTMVAYGAFSVAWFANHAASARFLTSPDYGVSLIWCAALGAFAAWAWLGPGSDIRRPLHPFASLACFAVMAIVIAYSDPMAAVQHIVAFAVGLGIISTADRSKILHRERHSLHRALGR
jgi:hypothetical protein